MRSVGRMTGCGTGHHSGHPRLGTIVQGSLRLSTLWGFRGSAIPFGTGACPAHAARISFPGRGALGTSHSDKLWEGAAVVVGCAQGPSSEGLPVPQV